MRILWVGVIGLVSLVLAAGCMNDTVEIAVIDGSAPTAEPTSTPPPTPTATALPEPAPTESLVEPTENSALAGSDEVDPDVDPDVDADAAAAAVDDSGAGTAAGDGSDQDAADGNGDAEAAGTGVDEAGADETAQQTTDDGSDASGVEGSADGASTEGVAANGATTALGECLGRLVADDGALDAALALLLSEGYAGIDGARLDALAARSVECGLVEEALGTNENATISLATPCLNSQLAAPGGGRIFVALSSIGEGVAVPEGLRPAFVGTMNNCLGAEVLADAIFGQVEADPARAGVVNRDCLAAELQASGVIIGIWESVAADPSRIELYDAGSDAAAQAALRCTSLGAIIVALAQQNGIELAPDTIACIDTEAALIDRSAGVAEEDLGAVLTGCLSEEELLVWLGG